MRSKDHAREMQKDRSMASHCEGMAKCAGDKAPAASKDDAPYQKEAGHWQDMAKCFSKSADDHMESFKVAKAEEDALDALGKRIVPDKISSVQSMDTPNFGIKAVPRHGAPSVDVDKTVLDRISPVFRHLLHEEEV